eukprot:m.260375 g.260375  ORF g.260375 m.260375 type:complete len:657 (+) comp15988_c0_seq1:192-2162(+)
MPRSAAKVAMRRGPAAPTKGSAAAAPARTMLWFRNDLRLTDNVIVAEAAAVGAPCLPVYIADPAVFGACTPPALGGRSRCGPHRARFVLEAVADLRARLRSVGSDLLVAVGDPVVVIPALLRAAASPALSTAASTAPPSPARTSVLVSDEPCPEEVATAEAVAAAVAREHGVLETRWQRTLYHPADLPPSVGIDSIAESSQRSRSYQFTSWRKKLEDELGQAERGIRPALPAPARLPPLWPSVRAAPDSLPEGIVGGCGFLPTLDDLGVPPTMHEVLWGIPPRLGAAIAADTRENLGGGPEIGLDPLVHSDSGCMAESNSGRFVGGETAGLARVQRWIGEQGGLASYVDTRNGLLGADFSSKFSPWLATGSLSPRTIIEAKTRWEAAHGASRSSYWLYFELLWRDWFSWMAVIAGPALFCPAGPLVALSASPPRGNGWRAPKDGWKGGEAEFVAWAQGKTGWPLVDAGMRELAASGFSSNRARQNVASFLALDLGCDWRLGAAWFEACLIDHDPTSNYGNWAAAAGLTGGRLNRFNSLKQSRDYDADGAFVRRWIPEIRKLPDKAVHAPWSSSKHVQESAGCIVGKDYPPPIKSVFARPKSGLDGKGADGKPEVRGRRRDGGGDKRQRTGAVNEGKWANDGRGRRRETGKNAKHLV